MSLHGCMSEVHYFLLGEDKRWWSTLYQGWNEYASSNDIIIIYPQVRIQDIKTNYRGCWKLSR